MAEGKAPPIGWYRNLAAVFEWRDMPIDNDASVTPTYVLAARCWCSLKVKAGEMYLNGAQMGEAQGPRGTHTIRTRFRPTLSTRHMFEIAGTRYRVVSVSNDDARRFTQLDVEQYGDAVVIGAPPQPPYWDTDLGGSTWDSGATRWDRMPRSAPTHVGRPPSIPFGLEEP
jgi:hypothetical protein